MKKFCAIAAAICCLIATVCARAAESDAPSWAVKFAANRLWTSPGAEIESAFAPEFELVEDEWILRGQSTIAPPVISPTPSTEVGTHTVATASTHIPLPPAVSQDTPFSPTQAPTTEDSTTIQKVFRNKQSCSLSYLFMPRSKKGLGVHEVEARALFACPCSLDSGRSCVNNGYFLLTPSFIYNNWSTPKEADLRYDMPRSTFNVALGTMVFANIGDLQLEVEAQVGVASSFQKLSAKAIYVNGRAMGSLPVDNEGRTRITGGVIYYDRINLKLIPSGGIIWRPNEQNELRLVFPDPRWSHYLTKANETDWWFFVRGEVGGGRYYISSKDKQTGLIRQFNTDYDDYRLSVGTMFDCASGMKGSFEIGGAFSRRLVVKAVDGGKWYTPKDSVFFKVGLHF